MAFNKNFAIEKSNYRSADSKLCNSFKIDFYTIRRETYLSHCIITSTNTPATLNNFLVNIISMVNNSNKYRL